MLHDVITKGATDRSVVLRIIDSTDGTPETGVVFNTSGIDLWYRREGAVKTSITEASLSALTDAHSDGGFLHIGDGNYRLDLPDAAVGSGANSVDFGGTVTGMIVIGGRIKLVNANLEDDVRLGLTALPNAAAEASGGLATLSAAQASNGTLPANVHRWLTGTPNALQSGRVDSYLGASAAGAFDPVWTVTTRLLTAGTNIALAKGTGVTGFNDLDASGVRSAVGLATNNLDTQLATLDDFIDTEVAAILAAVDTEVAAIKAKTDNLPAAPAAVGDVPTVGQIADQVWDEDITTHLGANSTGLALNSAGAAGDPWATALPGAYGAGSAGKIVGDNLNATVSSRLATAGYTAPLDAAGTRSAVGLATANLDTQLTTIDDLLDTEVAAILAAVDTEIAAIKAKTDQLVFTTANRVDARAFTVDDKTGYAIGTGGISGSAFAAGAIDATALNANAVDEIFDEQIGDSTVTARQALKLLVATLAGKLSGAGTSTITIRNVADTTNVVVATVDGTGNRSNLTLTL